MASDQKGQAGEQMARRVEMEEVSGLVVAHSEDQTYGEADRRGCRRMTRRVKSVVWIVQYLNVV